MNKNFCDIVIDEATKLAETIKQRRLEILEDTVKYFNNKTRNATDNNTCKYLPISEDSEGCALGRLIKDKELCGRLDAFDNSQSGVGHENIFVHLPEDLKVLGQLFLRDLQGLHDNPSNWDDKGLTINGKSRYTELKYEYCK